MNLSSNLQKKACRITDKQTAQLSTIQQRYSIFILFDMAVLSDTNLKPVPGD